MDSDPMAAGEPTPRKESSMHSKQWILISASIAAAALMAGSALAQGKGKGGGVSGNTPGSQLQGIPAPDRGDRRGASTYAPGASVRQDTPGSSVRDFDPADRGAVRGASGFAPGKKK